MKARKINMTTEKEKNCYLMFLNELRKCKKIIEVRKKLYKSELEKFIND